MLQRVTVKQPHTVFYMYSATYTILESSCNILVEQQHTAKSAKWKTCCKVQSRIQLQLHYTCCVRVTHAKWLSWRLALEHTAMHSVFYTCRTLSLPNDSYHSGICRVLHIVTEQPAGEMEVRASEVVQWLQTAQDLEAVQGWYYNSIKTSAIAYGLCNYTFSYNN